MKTTFNLVIENYDSLKRCISRLTAGGIATDQIVVRGSDCDNLRDATSALHTGKLSPLLLLLAGLGAAIGAYWGFICCAASSAPAISMAVLAGTVLGMWTGIHAYGLLSVDGTPRSDANFIDAHAENAVAVVSITSDESEQCDRIAQIIAASAA